MTWISGGHHDWFSVSVSEPTFRIKINRRASTLYQNFDDAANQAAQLLYQEWGQKPLYLALSGGMDSELTARILVKNNIPFTPIILKVGELNKTETWYAEYWCYTNNIKPIVLEYSVDKIIKETTRLSPKLNQIKNYLMTPVLLIYEYVYNLGGHCVFSAGDINLNLQKKKFFCASLDFLSNIVDPGNHPTSFFMYTPEIALSYIYQFDPTKSEQYNKIEFYKVLPRPKIDYLTPLSQIDGYKKLIDKVFYIFQLDEGGTDYQRHWHWYGTKEELLQQLQP